MIKLYVTRHGQTEWNLLKKLQGVGNSNLTEKGIKAAKCLHERLINTKIDYVISSPLGRTRETSKLVIGDRDIKLLYLDQLKEMDVGDFSGHTREEMQLLFPDVCEGIINNPIVTSYPNGENLQEFYDRCVEAVELIADEYYDKEQEISIMLIAHGGVVKCLESYFKGEMVPYNWFENTPANCSLSLYEIYNNKINIDNVKDNTKEIFYDSRTHLIFD